MRMARADCWDWLDVEQIVVCVHLWFPKNYNLMILWGLYGLKLSAVIWSHVSLWNFTSLSIIYFFSTTGLDEYMTLFRIRRLEFNWYRHWSTLSADIFTDQNVLTRNRLPGSLWFRNYSTLFMFMTYHSTSPLPLSRSVFISCLIFQLRICIRFLYIW